MDPKEELWLEGLKQGRTMCFRPLGGSMGPFLRPGDVVTIAAGPARVGDIVLAQLGDEMVLHRVVAKNGDRIITKGDALAHFDRPITGQQVLGRALTLERNRKISGLDSITARLCGLAFCLTLPFFPKVLSLLAKLKPWVQPGRSLQIAK
jgi:hypothetical protein